MARIGFIGTGEIAAPMVRFLARKEHAICVSERSTAISSALATEFSNVEVAGNQAVLDTSDIVFLCLRPQVWETVLPGLTFRGDHRLVSVMAGVPLAALARACAPATDLSVTLPIATLERGGCPLPVYPAGGPVEGLFGPENPVLPQQAEGAIDAHFAASTLCSTTLSALMAGAGWLAQETGDADMAETYVTALIAALLRDTPLGKAGGLAAERAALASPNTLNLQMVEGLDAAGVPDSIRATLTSILKSMESAT